MSVVGLALLANLWKENYGGRSFSAFRQTQEASQVVARKSTALSHMAHMAEYSFHACFVVMYPRTPGIAGHTYRIRCPCVWEGCSSCALLELYPRVYRRAYRVLNCCRSFARMCAMHKTPPPSNGLRGHIGIELETCLQSFRPLCTVVRHPCSSTPLPLNAYK